MDEVIGPEIINWPIKYILTPKISTPQRRHRKAFQHLLYSK